MTVEGGPGRRDGNDGHGVGTQGVEEGVVGVGEEGGSGDGSGGGAEAGVKMGEEMGVEGVDMDEGELVGVGGGGYRKQKKDATLAQSTFLW